MADEALATDGSLVSASGLFVFKRRDRFLIDLTCQSLDIVRHCELNAQERPMQWPRFSCD
jgi:hypothetical protein